MPFIEGQAFDQPLYHEAVGKGMFRGLLVLDRWMLWPFITDLVDDPGPHFMTPRYYQVIADARPFPSVKFHHSRCLRFGGLELPYWQRMAENYWDASVIERLYDRLVAFDSATTGAAQLVYRAYLRTLKVDDLRAAIAHGGTMMQGLTQQIAFMSTMQSIEGITLLDKTDEFDTHTYSFAGLSDALTQFGQQLSGAIGIPLVRLFGQSPAGLNSTGESDFRNYYDNVLALQENRLRDQVHLVLDLIYRHLFGEGLPQGFNFKFRPLWQLSGSEKAQAASTITDAVCKAVEQGIISPRIALKELRQSGSTTGVWTNISDADITAADPNPPPPPGQEGAGMPGAEGGLGGQPPALGGPGGETGPDIGGAGGDPIGAEEGPVPGSPEDDAVATDPHQTARERAAAAVRGTTPEHIEARQQAGAIVGGEKASDDTSDPFGATRTAAAAAIRGTTPEHDKARARAAATVQGTTPEHKKARQDAVEALHGGVGELGKPGVVEAEPNGRDGPAHFQVARAHAAAVVAGESRETAKDKLRAMGFVHDTLAIREVGGLVCKIETAKGQRRLGVWGNVEMPADYGFISGTSSAEGGREQMDCFVGEQPDSTKVWVIEQLEPATGLFDEHKVMLGFPDRQTALNAYTSAFNDGQGKNRIGKVYEMSIPTLKQMLVSWPYDTGKHGGQAADEFNAMGRYMRPPGEEPYEPTAPETYTEKQEKGG